jgi:quercetin dioxygenase-like cupin family protein
MKVVTMNELTTPLPIVRSGEESEQRWFYGGGLHTWLAKAEETGGEFFLFEDRMEGGKVTPLHTHPADESMYLLEGEIVIHMDGTEQRVAAGGLVVAPRGVPHAFMVVSEFARLLTLHTPGSCQAFYLGDSELVTAEHPASGVVDFDRVMASAKANGGIEILGPPPFNRPASAT